MRLCAVGIISVLLASGITPSQAIASSRTKPVAEFCGPSSIAAASTVYLPNITRKLGGPNGWYTPFIIQNTGSSNTELEVSFYRFTDGTCVQQYRVSSLAPGTAHSNDPNDN